MLELAVASREGDVQPSARNRPLCRPQRRREKGAAHGSLIVHRAAWVLPIAAPPIRDGWVAVDGGRIVARWRPGDRNLAHPSS